MNTLVQIYIAYCLTRSQEIFVINNAKNWKPCRSKYLYVSLGGIQPLDTSFRLTNRMSCNVMHKLGGVINQLLLACKTYIHLLQYTMLIYTWTQWTCIFVFRVKRRSVCSVITLFHDKHVHHARVMMKYVWYPLIHFSLLCHREA